MFCYMFCQAVSESGNEEQRDLSDLRRTLFLAIWILFSVYAFGPWSPGFIGDPADINLIISTCKQLKR